MYILRCSCTFALYIYIHKYCILTYIYTCIINLCILIYTYMCTYMIYVFILTCTHRYAYTHTFTVYTHVDDFSTNLCQVLPSVLYIHCFS